MTDQQQAQLPGGGPILRPAGIAEPSYESIRRRNTRMTAAVLATLGGLLLTGTVAYGWISATLAGSTGFLIALLVFSVMVLVGGPLALRMPRIAAGLILLGAIGVLVVFGIKWSGLEPILMLVGTVLAIAGGLVAIADIAREEGPRAFYRHSVLVRVTHWINAVAILLLVMSGLQIFNAHPGLYWGDTSKFDERGRYIDTALYIGPAVGEGDRPMGVVRIGTWQFETTGLFGASQVNGRLTPIAFPTWATLPSSRDLASGRLWHFFVAWIFVLNGLVYLVYTLVGRHFRRDLLPQRDQWKSFGRTVLDHARLRFHHAGDRRYNILQKLTYIGILIVFPVLIVAGLAMSPGLNAAFPWLPELFGGRQSARTIHFICAFLVVLFVVVHVALVLISGVWNNIISMFTGRYAVAPTREQSP